LDVPLSQTKKKTSIYGALEKLHHYIYMALDKLSFLNMR